MSVCDVIADALQNTPEGQSAWGHIGRAEQILDVLHAAGYVVAKVPGEVRNIFGDDRAKGHAEGWNAFRAAIFTSSEALNDE